MYISCLFIKMHVVYLLKDLLVYLFGAGIAHSSVLGLLSCLMQCCVFDTRGRNFRVEGIFHLELTWVLTPFLQNSFG